MTKKKGTAGPVERAVRRVVLGPKQGRGVEPADVRELTDGEPTQGEQADGEQGGGRRD